MENARAQILTVAQMRAAEQALIDAGETVSTLMEKAGRGAADWVWRVAARRPVTVLCGPGNNGGAGYVIARVLAERGLHVRVVAPLEPRTSAAIAARQAWGGEPVSEAGEGGIVDCLFGSGLTRPLEGHLLQQLQGLANGHYYRIAIDLPSGIDSDTGALLNPGLPRYELTIALGAWKFAHWTMPAMAHLGERRLVEIGVAPVAAAACLVDRPVLSAPAVDAHKYTRGLLGVVAGAMPGATLLAARAAMHGGAGYVKLMSPQQPNLAPPDLVVETAPLEQALADARLGALLVGPGLDRSAEAGERLERVLARDLPTVCDADALMLLRPPMLEERTAPLVATPHAGELAALCRTFGIDHPSRLERVTELARAMSAVILAKGPDTVIAAPDGRVLLMPPSSSWLSTAGTGDVLAGLVASRLSGGVDPAQAASEAAWLHREAARRAGPAFSASDFISHIPAAYSSFL